MNEAAHGPGLCDEWRGMMGRTIKVQTNANKQKTRPFWPEAGLAVYGTATALRVAYYNYNYNCICCIARFQLTRRESRTCESILAIRWHRLHGRQQPCREATSFPGGLCPLPLL